MCENWQFDFVAVKVKNGNKRVKKMICVLTDQSFVGFLHINNVVTTNIYIFLFYLLYKNGDNGLATTPVWADKAC